MLLTSEDTTTAKKASTTIPLSGDTTSPLATDQWIVRIEPERRVAFALLERIRELRPTKGDSVKVTVDSTEPLDDAIRVVGALYGVTLAVVDEQPTMSVLDAGEPGVSRDGKTATGRKAAASPAKKARTSGKGSATKKARASSRAGSPGSASNAEIRTWANANGLTVSGRGRIPASIRSAYRDAHS